MTTPLERLVSSKGGVVEDDVVVSVHKSMQDSDITPPTVSSGSVSSSEDGDNGGGWFGDFKTLAISIKDTLPPTIGGIADFVHRSALNVANEIAQLEAEDYENEWQSHHAAAAAAETSGDGRLPWELDDGTVDRLLMERVLQLSRDERTFLRPHNSTSESILTPTRIRLIRRLLELDENLATTHARLSGRSDVPETMFWQNYFCHCDRVRDEHMERMQLEAYLNPKQIPTEEEFCEAIQAHDQSEEISLPTPDAEPILGAEEKRRENGPARGNGNDSDINDKTKLAGVVQSPFASPAPGPATGCDDDDSLVPDDSSLVPVSEGPGEDEGDDVSYVIASPPASFNSFVLVSATRDFSASNNGN